jgi:hypothetical protein
MCRKGLFGGEPEESATSHPFAYKGEGDMSLEFECWGYLYFTSASLRDHLLQSQTLNSSTE